jgi:RecA-family ATPase
MDTNENARPLAGGTGREGGTEWASSTEKSTTAGTELLGRIDQNPAKLLFDPDTGAVPAQWLKEQPPERRFLLDDVLPLGKVGLLVAPGGTGKGWTLLQLAVGVAVGSRVLGRWKVSQPGSVLLIAGEDEPEELWRRLWTICQALRRDPAIGNLDSTLSRRLFLHSVVGEDAMLTKVDAQSNTVKTPFADKVLATALAIPDLRLVIVDPLSRFRGGEENDSQLATAFVQTLEHIAQRTGANILAAHHTNKGSQGNDASMSQGAARGATALTDGVRWQANLAVMTPKQAKDLGIDPEDRRRYVRLEVPKNNYAPPIEGMWLERQEGGWLLATDLDKVDSSGRRAPDHSHILAVVEFVRAQAVCGKEYSPRQFEDTFGGIKNALGISQKQLRNVIEIALLRGDLIKRPASKAPRQGLEVLAVPTQPTAGPSCLEDIRL